METSEAYVVLHRLESDIVRQGWDPKEIATPKFISTLIFSIKKRKKKKRKGERRWHGGERSLCGITPRNSLANLFVRLLNILFARTHAWMYLYRSWRDLGAKHDIEGVRA